MGLPALLSHHTPYKGESVLRPVISITGRGGRHGGIAIAHPTDTVVTTALNQAEGRAKADSTLRSSRAVPHPSTNRALRRLTSEFGRDPVHSTRYGRWRRIMHSTKKGLMMLHLCLRLQTNLLHSGLIRRKLKKACVTASARVWYLEPKWLR